MPGQGTEADVDPCGIQVGIPKEFLKKTLGMIIPKILIVHGMCYIYIYNFSQQIKKVGW